VPELSVTYTGCGELFAFGDGVEYAEQYAGTFAGSAAV
jgi:hypothetical protein